MDFIDDKINSLSRTIKTVTESEAWSNADTWGKMKLSWEKIIAEPFSEWWNSTGKAWLADKASKIGEGIGIALSAGLLALLGVDAKGAIEDGISIGASFAEGFSKGFDGKKVGEGIIPLSPSKRNRGIDLWQRTGEILGVQPYADGGIAGDEPEQLPKEVPTGGGQNITIKVDVKAEPKFTIEGDGDITDENKVLAVLKEYILQQETAQLDPC